MYPTTRGWLLYSPSVKLVVGWTIRETSLPVLNFLLFVDYVMLTWEKIPGSPHFSILLAVKAGRSLGARLASHGCCREWQMLIDSANHKHGHSLIKWVPHLCLVSMQRVPPIGALLQLSDMHGIDVLYCLRPGNCLHEVIELHIGMIMHVLHVTWPLLFHSAFLLPCTLLRSLGHSWSRCQAFPTSSFWLLVVRSKKGGKL